MSNEEKLLRARIGKIVNTSPGYFVAYPLTDEDAELFGLTADTSITVSRKQTYKGIQPGQIVYLSDIVKHTKGWRARTMTLIEATASASARS